MKIKLTLLIIMLCLYSVLICLELQQESNDIKTDSTNIANVYEEYQEFFNLYNKYLENAFETNKGTSFDYLSNLSLDELKRAYKDYLMLIYNDLDKYYIISWKNIEAVFYGSDDKSEYYVQLCDKYSTRLRVITLDNFRSIIGSIIEEKSGIPANQLSNFRIICTAQNIEEILPYHSNLHIRYVTFNVERFIGIQKTNTTQERIKILGSYEFLNDISYNNQYLVNYYFSLGRKGLSMITDHKNMFCITNNNIEYINYEEAVSNPKINKKSNISLWFFKNRILNILKFEELVDDIANYFEVKK